MFGQFHGPSGSKGAYFIEAGVDIYTVSRLLGCADVRITVELFQNPGVKFTVRRG